MKLFALLILSLFLVSCGNEYGIKKGTEVIVYRLTKGELSGLMHKVKSDVVILKKKGKIISIPKSNISSIQER